MSGGRAASTSLPYAAAALLATAAVAGGPPGGASGAAFRPAPAVGHPTFLIRGARIVDGTGAPAFRGSVRVHGDRVSSLGDLAPRPGERVVEAQGLVLAPGFIDAGGAVGRLPEDRDAEPAVSRGVTTVVVGARGHHRHPLAAWFDSLRAAPYAVNVASFAGIGTLRRAWRLRRPDHEAPAAAGGARPEQTVDDTVDEIEGVAALLRRELDAGALGLSVAAEPDLRRGSGAEIVRALLPLVEAAGGTLVGGSAHERTAGSWDALPGSLGTRERERRGVELEAAVHRLTGAAARRVGIRGSSGGPRPGRGVIEPLAYADLVLLDPERIADPAGAPADPGSFPGIVRVWVNGRQVHPRGSGTGARPGRVIRWPRM